MQSGYPRTAWRSDEETERSGGEGATVRLDTYDAKSFSRGRPAWLLALWILLQPLTLSSPLPGAGFRVRLLRLFGARIGRGVCIKPHVRVTYPWRLEIGDNSWIGEGVWIDSLGKVTIGNNCCLSQGAYLCTGSHDWGREGFDLIVEPITIEDQAWVAARSVVAPGVVVGQGAVLGLGSVATKSLAPWQIHRGVPATAVRRRIVSR